MLRRFGLGKGKEPEKAKEPPGVSLRRMILSKTAAEMGISPNERFPKVYGALLDWPTGKTIATVVSINDGTASLYTTAEFAILGGGGHETVRAAALEFVEVAQRYYDMAVTTTDFSYASGERVRFWLLGYEEVRMIEAELAAVMKPGEPLREFFGKGQEVLSQLRLITPWK